MHRLDLHGVVIGLSVVLGIGTNACMCGDAHITNLNETPDASVPFPQGNPNPSTCKTDCDCPPDQHCSKVGTEIQYNVCVNGTNTCSQPCNPNCPATQKCVNGVCQPKVCPTDTSCAIGLICKNGVCVQPACPTDFQCPTGQICVNGTCQPGCTPSCAGKQCGSDGCGGSCGSCPAGSGCNGTGQCVAGCTPQCAGLQCGPNGCGGTCGSCAAGYSCTNGQCVSSGGCTAQCAGKQCGPDGCGGSCGSCASGQSCNSSGQCTTVCSLTNPYVTVNGVPFATSYSLDISDFTKQEQFISDVLTLLYDLANGIPDCSNTSTSFGVIECLISVVVAANGGLNAPPWVSQLLQTLQALFQFGGQGNTVTANGSLTLTEATPCPTSLSATETWTHLYMTYNGTPYDLMNSPALGGTIGNLSVTVDPFSGTRDATNVYLGPRDIHFDVNKFILALIDVAISAATGGQDTDIPSLIDDVLCSQIDPIQNPVEYAACLSAATAIGNAITINSGLGGFHFDSQDAPIYPQVGPASATDLGTAGSPGPVVGQMYDGIISGQLGPTSDWYGHR